MLPFLLAAAQAATVAAPDGSYAVDAPDWALDDQGRLHRGRDAFTVSLLQASPTQGRTMGAVVDAAAVRAGASVGSWSGQLDDGREAACVSTAGTSGLLKPELHTWCAVDLGDDRAAVLRMDTRDAMKARNYGDHTRQLLDGVRTDVTGAVVAAPASELDLPPERSATSREPTSRESIGHEATSRESGTRQPTQREGAAPAGATAASERLTLMRQQGFTCTQGRWNPKSTEDDLRIYFNGDSHEIVVRFSVMDGTVGTLYYLAGTVDAGADSFFGHVERFEGPTESTTGIHRFFSSLDIQGELQGKDLVSFGTIQDEAFTALQSCPDWR